MLENNKVLKAKITHYGSGVAKASGKAYFFIDFDAEGIPVRWIGSPIKNDGGVNQLFAKQLASAGFDATKNTLSDMAKGMGSDVLHENGKVTIRVTQKQNKVGEMEWGVAWIGESQSITKEETAKALPENIDALMKGLFPAAVRKQDLGEIPF